MHFVKSFGKYVLIICFILLLATGCGDSTEQNNGIIKNKYRAYRKGDTATLLLSHSKSVFKGTLIINYGSTYTDSGGVRGFIVGDTLIGDFNYRHYGQPTWYRDPIRFLKKGNKLIMGKGVTQLTVGIPHFNPTVPVDYNEERQLVFYVDRDSSSSNGITK